MCPLNKPCSKPKTLQMIIMEGNEEKTIQVCEQCPLAKQVNMGIMEHEHCSKCGAVFADLVKNKGLGCEFCYLFMSSSMRKLIDKVQNKASKHKGKEPTEKQPPLLQRFFNQAISEYQKEHPEKQKTCEKLKKLLDSYF